jgi:hypothetical protein
MYLGLVDWSFIFTVGVILLGTLIGSYIRSSRRDRCLKDFDGYHVTVEKLNNRVIWGEMFLKPTGFELAYRTDVQDEDHLETSYILYKDEYDDIQAIYRDARDLSEEKRQQRYREMKRSFHPGLVRRTARSIRNFLNTATDSLSEVLGLFLGRARKPAAHLITETSESYLKDIGKNIIGYVGTSYDPLLEGYVGTRVVVEVVENEEIHEHVGVLKEYSARFLELLDVYFPMPQQLKLLGEGRVCVEDRVEVVLEGRQLQVRNTSQQPILLDRLVVGDQDKELDAIVPAGEQIVLHLDNILVELSLFVRVASRLDMIVPRNHSLIRHRAERYDPDTIFDVGLAFVRREGDCKEIDRLEQVLRYNPRDAVSAARLGELLYGRGELAAAHGWLLQAHEHRRHLPDNGNRVAQNLRRLERRMNDLKSSGSSPAGSQAAVTSANCDDPTGEIVLEQRS